MTTDILTGGLYALNFSEAAVPPLAEKLTRYCEEIELFNRAYNLVNAQDRDDLIRAHILDSLAGAERIRAEAENFLRRSGELAPGDTCASAAQPIPASPVCIGDIGSGGGLPGIPLAIALPAFQFILVERMAKRCAFLENCAAILGLPNVRVVHCEIERIAPASFAVTVFRAFRPLDAHFARALLAVTKSGGVLAAYKAKRANIKTEMQAIADIVPSYETETLTVPFLSDRERHLVLIRK